MATVVRGRVLGFYSHSAKSPYKEFSNFFWMSSPYEFQLPDFAMKPGFPPSVMCEFSEKAIMLTKAALMGDRETFDELMVAETPAIAKALGRRVAPFDEALWEVHLEDVAYEAVRQKFVGDETLREVLLSTGDVTIAEATRNDKIWGIGIDVGDPRVQDPKQWQGRNVLGQALMRTRDHLRGGV
mmetsp:Transcript_26609/g.61590  ORF Transcript_26609/g.61590 Transcript_26609/m.61590 type:complete len:184 (+) Transcript_26609:100-651(+)